MRVDTDGIICKCVIIKSRIIKSIITPVLI